MGRMNPKPLYTWTDEHGDEGRVMDDGSIEVVAGADLLEDGRYELMLFTTAESRAGIIAALRRFDPPSSRADREGSTS